MQFSRLLRAAAIAAVASAAGFTASAEAQSGRGFLFGEPHLTLSARGGVGLASAGSDVFDFAQEELTLSRSDFHGVSVFGDFGYRLASRIDLVASGGYIGRVARSESRGWEPVDEGEPPVRQRTEYRRVPLTAGIRLYPLPRGQSVGSYAWIPAQMVPYVGGSVGAMWYRFRQSGEFVDEVAEETFFDTFASSGWTPAAEAFAGLQYAITPRLAVTGEGRYTWAEADLSDAFEGFEPIDLAGFAFTVGVSIRR